MDDDEYQRMVAAGEQHWWYRSTRALLEMLVTPHLTAVDGTTIYLDAGGGSGATGSWLADRATTVVDDFEPIALKAAVHDHAGYRAVQADINPLPHGARQLRRRAVRDRAVPSDEPRPAGDRRRVRPRHQAGRDRVPDGAGRQAAVARSRRGDAHRPAIQPRRAAHVGAATRASTSSERRARTPSSFHLPRSWASSSAARTRAMSVATRAASVACSASSPTPSGSLLRKVDLPFGLSVIAIGRKPVR